MNLLPRGFVISSYTRTLTSFSNIGGKHTLSPSCLSRRRREKLFTTEREFIENTLPFTLPLGGHVTPAKVNMRSYTW